MGVETEVVSCGVGPTSEEAGNGTSEVRGGFVARAPDSPLL